MSCVNVATVHTRLLELLEMRTKDSFNRICTILYLPKREAEDGEKRHERLTHAIEVFNRIPQGCLWRRTKDEVVGIAKSVNVKASGKKKGIESLQVWHKNVLEGFAKAKETSSFVREGRALMSERKPIPIKILQDINRPYINKAFEQYIYMDGDIAFDHSKGRSEVLHFTHRSQEELAELEVFGRIVENPLDVILEQDLQDTEAFKAYQEREKEIYNFEAAPSLLLSEFRALAQLIDGIPEEIRQNEFSHKRDSNKWQTAAYLQRMKWNLYFAVNEWNSSTRTYQTSLI